MWYDVLIMYFVLCIFVGECAYGVTSSWCRKQLESFKIRRKSPHGGPYYYTVLQPDSLSNGGEDNLAFDSIDTADATDDIENSNYQTPEEHCDITETVEMVDQSLPYSVVT